jgi:hypothetical protein
MPRIGNLQNCKIYKITSLNNPQYVYYGHTCQTLARRFATHKSAYNKCKSKKIIEFGDAVILLVENFPCSSEDEAHAREKQYILNNECINRNIPGRTQAQYIENNKEKIKEYQKKNYENNKEKYKQKNKIYHENNKEYYKEYSKNDYENNKEYFKEYRKLRKEFLQELKEDQ